MSQLEKAKDRIRSIPSDYTYTEVKRLFSQIGFKESNKGKTSGSRVKFYREEDHVSTMIHKPHPGDIMSKGAVRAVVDFLMSIGEL